MTRKRHCPLLAPVGLRDRAMLGTLITTGCRIGVLCRLWIGDLRTHEDGLLFRFREKKAEIRGQSLSLRMHARRAMARAMEREVGGCRSREFPISAMTPGMGPTITGPRSAGVEAVDREGGLRSRQVRDLGRQFAFVNVFRSNHQILCPQPPNRSPPVALGVRLVDG